VTIQSIFRDNFVPPVRSSGTQVLRRLLGRRFRFDHVFLKNRDSTGEWFVRMNGSSLPDAVDF
jgi:hypothetical protein